MGTVKAVSFAVALAAAAGIGWFTLSPLFINKKVDEALPVAAAPAPSAAPSPVAAPSASPLPTPEAFSKMGPAAQQGVLKKSVEMVADKGKKMEDAMPADMPSLKVLAQGSFRGADALHKGSGTAKLIQASDGKGIVRLEGLNVTNGPDLYLYLAKHPDPAKKADVTDGGFVSLGKLKGNQGNQNYEVPTGTDPKAYGSVVVWCQLFGVLFSSAALRPT
jgi:hypothetical protein